MIPVKQNRFYKPGIMRGNCYPAVLASLLEMNVDDVIQIQEYYVLKYEYWRHELDLWLEKKGYKEIYIEGHLYDDEYYMVSGKSSRGCRHVCIYQNGKLIHDPHPSNEGLLDEDSYNILIKIN